MYKLGCHEFMDVCIAQLHNDCNFRLVGYYLVD